MGWTMTVVAGIVRAGHVYMGADSHASDDDSLYPRNDKKLFRNEEYLIGYCGSYRVGQVVQYAFLPPELPALGEDLHSFMVRSFVPSLISCLRDGDAIDDKNPAESTARLLVGVRGALFNVDYDFHVGIPQDYDAIGSGCASARASLFTTETIDPVGSLMSPRVRLELALTAAVKFTTTCGGDLSYLSSEDTP